MEFAELKSAENSAGSGKQLEIYAAAMQHAATLMAAKGVQPAEAAAKAVKLCVL